MKKVIAYVLGLGIAVVMVALSVPISYWLTYYIANLAIVPLMGNEFINGLNLLLGTNRFTIEKLPQLIATMNVVGIFLFKKWNSNIQPESK